MPAMSSSTVHAARAVTLWSIRAVAVWMTAWGVFQIGARLTYALSLSLNVPGQSLFDGLTVFTDIGETHGLFRGLPTLILGLALAALSARLAAWIVRPPSAGCARCGHPLPQTDRDTATRCPECGYADATHPARPTPAG